MVSRYYQDAYQGMDLFQENDLVFAYEKGITNNTDSDNILMTSIMQRNHYSKILLILESNDNKMEVLLKEYINKRKTKRIKFGK
uniref:Uncharacterized protein n=1 Tax=Rhizophagus irregularis (strain DAOM 181602 / DAOM 197198 / MUCL 43194) TaxID=747089 RepID=U9U3D1_RHIID